MGNNEQVKQFDEFFVKNYNYLLSFTKSIDCKSDFENLLHTVYLKCRANIEEKGYIGNEYMNFTRVALMNTYKSQYRSQKNKTIIDIEDPNYNTIIEETLLTKSEQVQQEELLERELSYIINGIYEYLEIYFNKKEVFIFKTYFLLKHKHLNYKQLSDATGYSMTSVSNIIKRIKKELRQNLAIYLKTGNNMAELLRQLEILFCKSPTTYWREYLEIYKKIYGTNFQGCKCKSEKIRTVLREWYNQNKQNEQGKHI
jgi:DNA-directed RNA polymerase specialized sigma24 family protein